MCSVRVGWGWLTSFPGYLGIPEPHAAAAETQVCRMGVEIDCGWDEDGTEAREGGGSGGTCKLLQARYEVRTETTHASAGGSIPGCPRHCGHSAAQRSWDCPGRAVRSWIRLMDPGSNDLKHCKEST